MWTKEDLEYLKEKYEKTDNRELALYFNKKIPTIVRQANIIGLKKHKNVITKRLKENNPGVFFTKEEDDFLIVNFDNMSYNEMSKKIKKTKKSIQKRIKKLGLKKTKKGIGVIITKNNKKRGRDLSEKNLKKIALRYNTKGEFYLKDPGAYSAATKNNLLNKICQHMVVKNFSIPQLILKDILEFILKEKCKYNDRKEIKPLEIDCYFNKWKIGWEYDGKRFHNGINEKKIKACEQKGIVLFFINENSKSYRKYEENIKNQIIKQLKKINKITGLKITKKIVKNYIPKIIYPNILTEEDKAKVKNKKMSEIKKIDILLFNKIKKYKLFLDKELKVIYDLKTKKNIKTLEEYLDYIKKSGIKSFTELTKREHPYRIAKKLDFSIDLIKDYFKQIPK